MKWIALFVIGAAGIAGAQENQPDPARQVRERLASMRVTIDFTGAPLGEVIAYFQEFSGLNFHIEEEARARDEKAARITIKVRDVSMKAALRLILHPRDLRCVLRNGVIVVTTKDRVAARMITRVYDIRDVMLPLREFCGPRMELEPPGSGRMGCCTIFPDEDPRALIDADLIVDLIKVSISEQSWDGDASISQMDGLLIVSQTSSVQAEVSRLLERLRFYK